VIVDRATDGRVLRERDGVAAGVSACGAHTMESSAAAAADDLADSLIGPQGRSSVADIARRLPFALSSIFGFECRLNGAPHTDILFYVTSADGGREVLSGVDPAHALHPSLLQDPIWTRVRDFGQAWATPGSPVADRIKDVWLEFDVDEGSDALPVPSVFIGFGRSLRPETGGACGSGLAIAAHPWITGTVVPLLLGRPLPTGIAGKLHDCFAALPLGTWVGWIGLMLPRGSDAIRLCPNELPAAQLPHYLSRIGWSGSSREFEAIDAAMPEAAFINMVNIDVAESIGARIGVEYRLPWAADPSTTLPLWSQVLDRLVEAGLCSAEQRDDLLAWPGVAPLPLGGAMPSDASGLLDTRLDSLTWDTLVRYIHHVKISFVPDGALEAKAYLMCRRRGRTWSKPRQPQCAEASLL
jgi:hypothetical protein